MVIGNFIPLSAATPEPAIPEGAGTQNNPFLITSVENLLWMSQTANQSAGRYYQLKNSIDRLLAIKGDKRLLCGHDKETSLDHERKCNLILFGL